jgi:hypothetical protein
MIELAERNEMVAFREAVSPGTVKLSEIEIAYLALQSPGFRKDYLLLAARRPRLSLLISVDAELSSALLELLGDCDRPVVETRFGLASQYPPIARDTIYTTRHMDPLPDPQIRALKEFCLGLEQDIAVRIKQYPWKTSKSYKPIPILAVESMFCFNAPLLGYPTSQASLLSTHGLLQCTMPQAV